MIKIKKLRVEGFRGIINSAELDFENGRSLVLWGYNGDGKSSFSYALEWLLKGSIAHLNREDCGIEDYRHRELEKTKNALVSVEFTDAKLNNTRKLDASLASSSNPNPPSLMTLLLKQIRPILSYIIGILAASLLN